MLNENGQARTELGYQGEDGADLITPSTLLTLEAAYADYMHSSDPIKQLVHNLRAAACDTIALYLSKTDIGPLPQPETIVNADILKQLSSRVRASFAAIENIGDAMVT